MTGPDLVAVSENDEEVARLEKQLEEAEEKLVRVQYEVNDLQTDNKHLKNDNSNLELDKKVHQHQLFHHAYFTILFQLGQVPIQY